MHQMKKGLIPSQETRAPNATMNQGRCKVNRLAHFLPLQCSLAPFSCPANSMSLTPHVLCFQLRHVFYLPVMLPQYVQPCLLNIPTRWSRGMSSKSSFREMQAGFGPFDWTTREPFGINPQTKRQDRWQSRMPVQLTWAKA